MSTETKPTLPTQSVAGEYDARTARVLDSLGIGVLIAGIDRTIRYRNTMAAEWLPLGKTIDDTFSDVRFVGRFDGWEQQLSCVIDQLQTLRLECAIPAPRTRTPLLATLRCSPLRGSQPGHADGVVVLVEEGSPEAAVEERLQISERLVSLGRLASRVAHELNNPLDGILRYINLAMRLVDDAPDERLRKYLTESRTGLLRMVQIIGDLLEFSRTTEGEFEQMHINEVVEQAIRANAAASQDNRVVVTADFQTPDMPSVRGSRLHQVCVNLIKNAVDAMPDGGRLTLTTGTLDDQVVIRVADTGPGLPDPPEKVFEAFFTTKAAGKGTGIGLAICKDFIEDMKGTIDATPGEEGGAVFTVRIPITSCQPPTVWNTAPPGNPRK